jgi:hypothetical protein
MYDPATDKWTTMAPMPEPLQYNGLISIDSNMVSIVLDDKIYVFGSSHVQIFDPQTNSWTLGPLSTVEPGYWVGAATTGVYAPKKLYISGENCAQIFDPQTGNWSTSTIMPERIQNFGVAVVDDVFFVVGGQGVGQKVFQDKLLVDSYYTPNQTYCYTPLGYTSATPVLTDLPNNNLSLTITVAGIIVAVSVVAAVSLLLFRKKPSKPSKTGQTV